MSNKIQTANQVFNFNGSNVRTTIVDSKVYFVGKDIASILGYTNPQKAIRDHCKVAVKYSTPTNGGKQEMSFIPEHDVYRLVMRSKLPEAEKFQDWVCEEVLPSIKRVKPMVTPNGQMYILEKIKGTKQTERKTNLKELLSRLKIKCRKLFALK